MNILSRIIKLGQAEIQSVMDQLEDPIKMTEQGIRDLKEDLDKGLRALAEVKALAIRARHEAEACQAKAGEYETKAGELLQRAHEGHLDPVQADRLAGEALLRKEEQQKLAQKRLEEQQAFEEAVAQQEGSVKTLKATIHQWENELKTLKSRVTVSNATRTINKQLAQIDSHGTVALLERMKEKVAVEEALAESYGELAQESRVSDQDIDQGLAAGARKKAADEVAALKAKLGLENQ